MCYMYNVHMYIVLNCILCMPEGRKVYIEVNFITATHQLRILELKREQDFGLQDLGDS